MRSSVEKLLTALIGAGGCHDEGIAIWAYRSKSRVLFSLMMADQFGAASPRAAVILRSFRPAAMVCKERRPLLLMHSIMVKGSKARQFAFSVLRYSSVAESLERQGVATFVQSWNDLIAGVTAKLKVQGAEVMPTGAVTSRRPPA